MTQHILTTAHYLQKPVSEFLTLLSKVGVTLSGFFESIQRANQIRQGIRELNSLTDYELKDIGISRGDIYSVATGHKDMAKVADVEVNDNLKGFV